MERRSCSPLVLAPFVGVFLVDNWSWFSRDVCSCPPEPATEGGGWEQELVAVCFEH